MSSEPVEGQRSAAAALGALVGDPVVAIGTDGEVLDCNDAAGRLLGLLPDDLVGSPLPTGLLADPDAVWVRSVLEGPVGVDAAERTTVVRRPDGDERTVRIRVRRLEGLGLVVLSPADRTGDAPAPADAAARLARAETALRNIAWELRVAGIGTIDHPAQPSSIDGATLATLTGRERDVLRVFLRTVSVAVSAQELHVSEHTVRSHLKSIYRKVGVRSQTELLLRMAPRAGDAPRD